MGSFRLGSPLPPGRAPAALFAVAAAFSIACGSFQVQRIETPTPTYRDELNQLYPPGTARRQPLARAAIRHVRTTTLAASDTALDSFAHAALESLKAEGIARAAGFDQYELIERADGAITTRDRWVCDYVFFDRADRVIRAYRRYRPCPS